MVTKRKIDDSNNITPKDSILERRIKLKSKFICISIAHSYIAQNLADLWIKTYPLKT